MQMQEITIKRRDGIGKSLARRLRREGVTVRGDRVVR